jgi:hypothetical protein
MKMSITIYTRYSISTMHSLLVIREGAGSEERGFLNRCCDRYHHTTYLCYQLIIERRRTYIKLLAIKRMSPEGLNMGGLGTGTYRGSVKTVIPIQ